MDSRALKGVVEYLKKNNNELSRLSYAKDILARQCLSCDQALKIMQVFKTKSSQQKYLEELKKGYLTDKENIAVIEKFIAQN